jgi:hypothetical protein
MTKRYRVNPPSVYGFGVLPRNTLVTVLFVEFPMSESAAIPSSILLSGPMPRHPNAFIWLGLLMS